MYDWLLGAQGCDEASLISFFALLQFSPEGRRHAENIYVEMHRQQKRNPSTFIAANVETARRDLNPDGEVYSNMPGRSYPDIEAYNTMPGPS